MSLCEYSPVTFEFLGVLAMIREFLRDRRGNYALLTAVALVPIMGGLALAVDYTQMAKQRQQTMNALDAAGIATARRIVEGATDDQAKAYAKSFFETNLGSVDPADTQLTIVLPQNNTGGGTLKLTAALKYKPYFLPTFKTLVGKSSTSSDLDFSASSEIRLKNTLEVALVLDNSGSMNDKGTGSGKKRIDLLKDASKQLVDNLAGQAAMMKQISKPVQFALVPFSASVNVGPDSYYKDSAPWLDLDGISPIHHENFDWSTTISANKKMQQTGGVWYKTGSDWGTEQGEKVTRFTLYKDIKRITGYHQEQTGTTTQQKCTGSGRNRTCKDETVPVYSDIPDYAAYANWSGCIEARPYPYNTDDTAASKSTPATLFVPMFAPDEPDAGSAPNNYWTDSSSVSSTNYLARQRDWRKYYTPAPNGTSAAASDAGPNEACTTSPITPLTDVSSTGGQDTIKASIDAMAPTNNTNVPEGMAWGWRVLSHGAPFTEGRPESEKGNDKVVIVLTDGANTYSTPGGWDYAGNKSTYAAYGYAGVWPSGYTTSRIFQGTSVSKTDYSNSNYTKAMDDQFKTLCDNAKTGGLIVMTVSLDLRTTNTAENKAIEALKACASDSRFRKDPTTGKAVKLYWNTTGSGLADTFKDIANELSNLRIVG